MTKQKLARDMDVNWMFSGDLPAGDDARRQ
jgi:hypothetical protein